MATKLEQAASPPPQPVPTEQPAGSQDQGGQAAEPTEQSAPSQDGTLEIAHDDKPVSSLDDLDQSNQLAEKKPEETPKIHIDDQGALRNIEEAEAEKKANTDSSIDPTQHLGGSRMILQPPSSMSNAGGAGGPDGYQA